MYCVSKNLYRFDSPPRGKARRTSYSYLLLRKGGNLLICSQESLVTDFLDEIGALGGIHTQLLTNYRDGKKGDYHDGLYERFGCRLCYHEAERKMARTKTKCPEITFGDEGLQLGPDFQAHHFPNRCQNGNSLFRWRYRGKYHLFPGEVVTQIDGEWDLEFNPELWPDKRSQFAKLTKLHVDLLFPAISAEGEEDIHRFTDRTRKAFRASIRAKLQPRKGGLKARDRARRVRVVTNYVPEDVMAAIEAEGQFEFDKMKVHGNCALSLLLTYVEGSDIMLFNGFRRQFRTGHPFIEALRGHVEEGGGLLLSDTIGGGHDKQIVATHPFPEIAVRGAPAAIGESEIPELTVQGKHPATGGLADNLCFAATVHEGKRHRHLSYEGRTFEPGVDGQVLVRNASGAPVVVVGTAGKGRVVLSGVAYGVGGPVEGPARQIYEGTLRWLAGME